MERLETHSPSPRQWEPPRSHGPLDCWFAVPPPGQPQLSSQLTSEPSRQQRRPRYPLAQGLHARQALRMMRSRLFWLLAACLALGAVLVASQEGRTFSGVGVPVTLN